MNKLLGWTGAAALIFTVGCANDSNSTIMDSTNNEATSTAQQDPYSNILTRIADREWVVEDIQGRGIIDASRVTLNFTAEAQQSDSISGRLYGLASCNSYTATYRLTSKDNRLQIEPAAATKKLCPPALMNQEQAFFDLLNNIMTVEINEKSALRLQTADGESLLAR